MFERIDHDGNGVIQVSELAESMKEIVPDVTDDEIEEIFQSTDKDKNGTISLDEFKAAMWSGVNLIKYDFHSLIYNNVIVNKIIMI